MELVAGLIIVASTIAFLVGVFMLILLKSRRRHGGMIAFTSVVIFFAAIIATEFYGVDRVAQRAGFESWLDQQAATAAGIADPLEWKLKRTEIEAAFAAKEAERIAAERDRAAAAKAERERAEAEAKAKEAKVAEERRFASHCLSPQDGSHLEFVSAVKARLRATDSFEHIETRVLEVDEEGRNIVHMAFWMRDRFGEKKLETALGSFANETCGSVTVEFIQ